jgi:hypothetical protein
MIWALLFAFGSAMLMGFFDGLVVSKHDEIHIRVMGIRARELVWVGRIAIGYLWQVAWHKKRDLKMRLLPPNHSLERTPVGHRNSAFTVDRLVLAWLSFCR